jgi:hypothetical protein
MRKLNFIELSYSGNSHKITCRIHIFYQIFVHGYIIELLLVVIIRMSYIGVLLHMLTVVENDTGIVTVVP